MHAVSALQAVQVTQKRYDAIPYNMLAEKELRATTAIHMYMQVNESVLKCVLATSCMYLHADPCRLFNAKVVSYQCTDFDHCIL